MKVKTEIKEYPILFSTPMVKAISDGRKTQARRPVEIQPEQMPLGFYWESEKLDAGYCHTNLEAMQRLMIPLCPYGKVGDVLWVRETWSVHKDYNKVSPALVYIAMGGDTWGCINYAATPRKEDFWGERRPSTQMPRWASRINLEILAVRVEQIQDISFLDIIAEGIRLEDCKSVCENWPADGSKEMAMEAEAKRLFNELWDSANEKPGFGWDSNPWVWVVEFKEIANENNV